MEILPAIDIINGVCVRLEEGDYSRSKTYHQDPVEVAKQYEDLGFKRLHLVDLDGAKANKVVNLKVLQDITASTALQVDFGGGVKTTDQATLVLENGAAQLTGGSVAAKNPEVFRSWLETFGPEKIILGADVKDKKVMVSGWQESTSIQLDQYLKGYQQLGVKYVICTDISKDGMMQGPAFELYRELIQEFPSLKFIASGGVTTLNDVEQLEKMGMYGAIIGKALYEGTIAPKTLAEQYVN
jgi:phosphoribosylformimino-5-aminoimidazole carboxamide ribotide isomerase